MYPPGGFLTGRETMNECEVDIEYSCPVLDVSQVAGLLRSTCARQCLRSAISSGVRHSYRDAPILPQSILPQIDFALVESRICLLPRCDRPADRSNLGQKVRTVTPR